MHADEQGEEPKASRAHVEPSLRVCLHLAFTTMPMGNAMPMRVRAGDSKQEVVVDAHNVGNVPLDDAIAIIGNSVHSCISPQERMLRRQIADTVVLTMGDRMTHYEGSIDPRTGTALIDFTFRPRILPAAGNDHLPGNLAYDPQSTETKIKDCAVLRTYCTHIDPDTRKKVPFLIASEAIDLVNLMERSILVSSMAMPGAADAEKQRQFFQDRSHDFALRHNFCNTCTICSVLPVWATASHFAPIGSPSPHVQVHHDLHVPLNDHTEESMRKKLSDMRGELDRLKTGVRAYLDAADKNSDKGAIDLANVEFMPSSLRLLPHVSQVVRMQQALQHAYCAHAVDAGDAVPSEPNSLAYTSSASFLQTHQFSVQFPIMTAIHEMRAPMIPRRQLMVQFYAAMALTGVSPAQVMQWRADTHGDEIASFLHTVISASNIDQVQSQYQYDLVVHSVMPVPEAVATANLQPIPGVDEYAPGCESCIYKQFELPSSSEGGTGQTVKQWFRINMAVNEDLCQLRAGTDLNGTSQRCDCEDDAQHAITVAKALMNLKALFAQLEANPGGMTMGDLLHPDSFPHMSQQAKADFADMCAHLLSQVVSIRCKCTTANAYGGQASANSEGMSLTGHAYGIIEQVLNCIDPATKTHRVVRTVAEGTKWTGTMLAGVVTRSSRNAGLDQASMQGMNQIAELAMQSTKLPCPSPEDGCASKPIADVATPELQVVTNKGKFFYANAYFCGDEMMGHESVPGIPTSPLSIGAPLSYVLYRIPSLRTTRVRFNLVATHMKSRPECPPVDPEEIRSTLMRMAAEESFPTWSAAEWKRHAFDGYLPCHTLFEDEAVSRSFDPSKHCSFSFTHQYARGMTMEKAHAFAANIRDVLSGSVDPPITKDIHQRIRSRNMPFAGAAFTMPQQLVDAVSSFDPAQANAAFRAAVANSAIRVERISTCMGSVLTTCIVDKASISPIANALISWAKPIVQATEEKNKVAASWRMQVERRILAAQEAAASHAAPAAASSSAASAAGASIAAHAHRHARSSRVRWGRRNAAHMAAHMAAAAAAMQSAEDMQAMHPMIAAEAERAVQSYHANEDQDAHALADSLATSLQIRWSDSTHSL